MRLWVWSLVISTAAIFTQILLAGLFIMGFPVVNFHISLGHGLQLLLLISLILAWRQKAGRRMVYLISTVFLLAVIQANAVAIFVEPVFTPTNTILIIHGIIALILYTSSVIVTVIGFRQDATSRAQNT